MSVRARLFGALRNEEYTGANRCTPCTVVNLLIAAGLALLAAQVTVGLGLAVFVLSAVAIALRGYLIPGTPALTKRYLPNPVLELFGKRPDEDDYEFETLEKLDHHREHAVDPEEFLIEAGAVTTYDGRVGDLQFADEFGERVDEHLDALRERDIDPETVAELFDADPDEVTDKGRDYPAFTVGRRVRKWPSRSSLVSDIAVHRSLVAQTDEWTAVPVEQRMEMLESLRAFHDRCPLCDGELVTGEDVVESCCAAYEVISVSCTACAERVLEFDPEKVGDAEGGIRP